MTLLAVIPGMQLHSWKKASTGFTYLTGLRQKLLDSRLGLLAVVLGPVGQLVHTEEVLGLDLGDDALLHHLVQLLVTGVDVANVLDSGNTPLGVQDTHVLELLVRGEDIVVEVQGRVDGGPDELEVFGHDVVELGEELVGGDGAATVTDVGHQVVVEVGALPLGKVEGRLALLRNLLLEGGSGDVGKNCRGSDGVETHFGMF